MEWKNNFIANVYIAINIYWDSARKIEISKNKKKFFTKIDGNSDVSVKILEITMNVGNMIRAFDEKWIKSKILWILVTLWDEERKKS